MPLLWGNNRINNILLDGEASSRAIMTEKQFWASKWKPFEKMTVFIKKYNRNCECYLVGIDFEERKMKLRILDSDIFEDQIIEVPIKIIMRGSEPKMKIKK